MPRPSGRGLGMTTMLDTIASRAVYAARLFERAVHDPGPWAIECRGVRFSAERIPGETEVRFSAELPFSETGTERIALYCRDELVSVREVVVSETFPEGLSVDWTVELVPVSA